MLTSGKKINSATPQINSRWQDAITGLSVAGLLLPEAVAYSSIANLPAQAGIIALFAGLVCYGLIGTSRFAIVSATSSSAAVLAAATLSLAGADSNIRLILAVGLVLVTSLFFILASVARLGNITDFIAKPVLRGFAFGLAIVIILKQCVNIVGVSSHTHNNDIFELLLSLITQSGNWNLVGVSVGIVSLGLLFLLERYRYVPGGIIVIGLGIFMSQWLQLSTYGVHLIGSIQLQFNHLSLPELSKAEWLRLGELGFAMVMILYSESYSSIRTFALKHGDSISPNRDLLALGVANLVSGLFHGLPVGAGYSATSVNEASGASTRFAGITAALVVLIIVLTLLPYIAFTPEPVLAAIVIHAVSRSLNYKFFSSYFVWRRDRLVVFSAVMGVLLFGILDGLLLAIGISLIMILRQFSESKISILGRLDESHNFVDMVVHTEAKSIEGIIIFRPDEQIFFANSDRILSQIQKTTLTAGLSIHTIIISLEETFDLDSSTLEALLEFFKFIIKEKKHLVLARLKHPVHQILNQIVKTNSIELCFSGLSVDDAVRIAQSNTRPKN